LVTFTTIPKKEVRIYGFIRGRSDRIEKCRENEWNVVRPCKTGKFPLRPYQNDFGN